MRVECTANGSDPKSRAKYANPNLMQKRGLSGTDAHSPTKRRRKSSPGGSTNPDNLIQTPVKEESGLVLPGAESVQQQQQQGAHLADPRSAISLRLSESGAESHGDARLTPTGAPDGVKFEYLNDVGNDSGSWHALEKPTSRGSRHEHASQSPRSTLADYGIAESAVGISKKVSR